MQAEYDELNADYEDLSDNYQVLSNEYGALLEQLKWTHGILSILIEEQGGLIQIPKATLETYPLNGTLKVYEDIANETYIIEVVEAE